MTSNKCAACPYREHKGTCLGIVGRCLGELGPRFPAVRQPRNPGGPIQVGLVAPCLHLGGAESVDDLLVRSTDPARIEWAGSVCIEPESDSHPAAVRRLSGLMPVAHGLGSVPALADRVDVLVSWAPIDYGRIFQGKASRPRLVQLAHFPAEGAFSEAMATHLGPVDRWVAVSELAIDSMPPSVRPRASIIWNAVDRDRLVITRDRATMLNSWGIPEDRKVAGSLARISEEKDPDALLRLARCLPSSWFVVLVGDGRDRARIAREAGPNVRVVGPDADVGSVLNAFDVLVVPSRHESFGLTLVEGLALGKPVVSSSVGVAKLVPELTHLIAYGDDGPTIARAVLAAHREGPRPAVRAFLPRLDPARFGREWTELLTGLVTTTAARAGVDPAVRDRVNACPSRGPVLPLSMQREGCQCGELSACASGMGKVPGRVTLRECLACKSG